MRRDPVTSETRRAVLARDGGCVAARLDASHLCRDRWGAAHPATATERMTLDHVKDQPRMGKRAPSDLRHLVTLCWSAHIATGWATSHRPELRAYLEKGGDR